MRHLVMPGDVAEIETLIKFLAERVSKDTYLNIMGQYRPAGKVSVEKFSEINQRATAEEINQTYQAAEQAGLWRFDQRR